VSGRGEQELVTCPLCGGCGCDDCDWAGEVTPRYARWLAREADADRYNKMAREEADCGR